MWLLLIWSKTQYSHGEIFWDIYVPSRALRYLFWFSTYQFLSRFPYVESVLVLHMVTISGKYHVLSRALRYLFLFSTCQFLSRYPYVESVLVLELKKSGHNFDKQSVDNFGDHIWNRQILLVYISKNEENRKTLWITAHEPANPTTHPDNLAHSALAVCFFGWHGREKYAFLVETSAVFARAATPLPTVVVYAAHENMDSCFIYREPFTFWPKSENLSFYPVMGNLTFRLKVWIWVLVIRIGNHTFTPNLWKVTYVW